MSEVLQFPRNPDTDFGELIAIYLETRDAKTKLERQQKEHLKQYTSVMARIEGKMMEHLQTRGLQSASSETGTAYLSHTRSAPIHDTIAFKAFIIEQRAWDMIDWKANVTAVGDFLQENDVLPPGVNYKSIVTLRVQKK
jgi:hypothetical protein